MLTLSALAFPNIDPVAFHLGPLAIHWYGIAYVVSILIGWTYAKRMIANEKLWPGNKPPMSATDLDDFILWATLGIVVGGRLGYVLFYNFAYYAGHPLEILALGDGGMSFHGGLLGTTIAMILFARKRKISLPSLIDTVASVAVIGIGLVRIANFINSELWGRVTDVSWGVIFPNGGPEPRHPSQLYEAALEGFLIFIVLRILTHHFMKLKAPLFVGSVFIALYGCARIFVEFFRVPDAQIGYLAGNWLTMGMVLSLPLVLIGICGTIWANRNAPKNQPIA